MLLKEFSLIHPKIEAGQVFQALETVIPAELIEATLTETKATEERKRQLPSSLVVCLVIAMSLWASDSMTSVLQNLVNGLNRQWTKRGKHWQVPSSSSISEARQRLGCRVMSQLFTRLARPQANTSRLRILHFLDPPKSPLKRGTLKPVPPLSRGDRPLIREVLGRVTQLKYDGAGNLKQVIDPDGSSRTWGYDDGHHMTSEIDQQGHWEQMFYDFAGRADRAIRKDGSELDFDPVQVQGLYPPNQTTNPNQAPVAYGLNETPTSTYLNANGHSTTTFLDQAGQKVSATDAIGLLPSVERNPDNQVTNRTDGRGYQTEYTYDERGNLITIVDRIKISNPQTDPSPFQATVNYSLVGSLEAMAVGDLNGDNCSDLVLGHSLGVSLLLSNGDGTLALPTALTSLKPRALALSDLNHDGHLDLVTATSGDISVWFGQGDGTLREPIKTPINYTLTDLVLGDFNGDGTIDAVVAGESVALFLGTGSGTFTAAAQTDDLVGSNIYISHLDLESADLDEDGHLDLAVAFTGSGYGSDEAHLVLFFGQGDGRLGEKVAYQVDGKHSALGVGDLDGDTDADLVTANPEDEIILIWLNGGDRSLSLSTSGAVGRYPNDLTLGDVNADGQLDVIVANQVAESVSVLLGNGDGSLVPQTQLSLGGQTNQVRLADVGSDK